VANQDDERHASRKIAGLLRAEIEREGTEYPPGTRLPSYRLLMSRYGVAQNTAQKAVQLLQAEGLVEIRAQSGAYVRDPVTAQTPGERHLRADLADLHEQLGRAKRELATAEEVVAGLLESLPAEGPTQ
jgi:DNA-binding GntR family transcriptional regulator